MGVLIFTGAPAPDPQIAPLPHLNVAAFSHPRVAALPHPRFAAFSHPHVAVLSRPDDPAVLDQRAALPSPMDPVLAVPQPDLDLSSRETPDQCTADPCIDRYLWSLYQRTPKVDTIKVPEQIRVLAKKKGKTITVTKTVMKLVDEDFAWKDAKAAEQAGMSLPDYVIGGMDRTFRLTLYHALRALDDAGLAPGITSGFRDDYRQSIASGLKAASDRSYHGGSFRGGYGHGLAADLVSVKGETRSERLSSSGDLWKWIDAHGQELGIGRPYLDRDPPHVGPIDGQEYADHRGAKVQQAALEAKKPQPEAKKHVELEAKKLAVPATKQHAPRGAQVQQVASQAKKPQPEAKKHGGLEAKKLAVLATKQHAQSEAKHHAGLEAKKPHRPAAPAGEHHPAKRSRTARA